MPQLHFVVVTIGSAGDLFPFMRVALALRDRGHRVTMLGPMQHAPFVEPTGLAFHGLPADETVLDHPDLWHPTRGLAVVWRATRPAMAQVPAFVAALPRRLRVPSSSAMNSRSRSMAARTLALRRE